MLLVSFLQRTQYRTSKDGSLVEWGREENGAAAPGVTVKGAAKW
jgi:hypothetical protein